MNHEIVEHMNNFCNNSFIYNKTRKQLQKDSLKLRKIISREKITDYTPYSFAYLYLLCDLDTNQFLQILPTVLKNNPILALLYTAHTNNLEKSYITDKLNCQIIPNELTKNIIYACQCVILQNINYCVIYIDKNIFPVYTIYDDFDNNIQQFFHTIHDKYIDNLFTIYTNNSNKLIKFFFSFYPYLNENYINHILNTIARLKKDNCKILILQNILEKINKRVDQENISININLLHKLNSQFFLTELYNN